MKNLILLRVPLFVIICIIFVGCLQVIEGRKVKIRKCCPPDEVIDISRMKCKNSGDIKWTPWFYKGDDIDQPSSYYEYDIMTRIPNCESGVGVHILPLKKISSLNLPETR